MNDPGAAGRNPFFREIADAVSQLGSALAVLASEAAAMPGAPTTGPVTPSS